MDLFERARGKALGAALERAERYGVQSACHLPLTTARRRLGILVFACKQPDAYERADASFLQLVANQVAVAVENALAFQEIEALRDQLARENAYLQEEVRTEHNFGELIGESAALRRVLKEAEMVAPTGSTVLIRGESGTGKELVARALHDLSPRQWRTFVKLNCAAIPTGLLESELFGHEKGAFTGAIAQKVGRFELANGGTLFLDEVGDIPLELQPKLLRVLQEQEFERLGGTRTVKVDVRLVAATNRDLARMVADGRFRSDLYYRLNVFPIALPPLRERREDIPRLVRHFTQRFARRMGRQIETIPSAIMDALVGYPWPGNVRELQNFIERAVILTSGRALQVRDMSWSSWFRINSPMVARLKVGRLLLGGDSAHIHSPAGAQGMNTGIQDMVNLAWKLALVLKGQAPATLLDTYEQERLPVIRDVLAHTDGLTNVIASEKQFGPWTQEAEMAQDAIATRMGQLATGYRDSPLSATYSHEGLHAGDRVPDLQVRYHSESGAGWQDRTLFGLLDPSRFTLLAVRSAESAAAPADLYEAVQPWRSLIGVVELAPATGAARERFQAAFGRSDGVFLVRPDGYVGFASGEQAWNRQLDAYCRLWLSAPARAQTHAS
jgi:DNA-binding NtrC family response regulator